MSKLNQAKERLSRAFADLEVAMLDKINQVQSPADKEDQDVNHFHNEINSLQNELSELGIENEKLRSFKSLVNTFENAESYVLSQCSTSRAVEGIHFLHWPKGLSEIGLILET